MRLPGLLAIISLFVATQAALADDAVLQSFNGAVEMKTSKDRDWEPAKPYTRITEGGEIRTVKGSNALVSFPNSAQLWMAENAHFGIEENQDISTRLDLYSGRVKFRVPHLAGDEIFTVRTTASVCSVARNAEFVMSATEEGEQSLWVLFGGVQLQYLVPLKDEDSLKNITQGQAYRITDPEQPGLLYMMNADTERGLLQDWTPHLSRRQRVAVMDLRADNRKEMRDYAKSSAMHFVPSLGLTAYR
jgi:hypothetical protein